MESQQKLLILKFNVANSARMLWSAEPIVQPWLLVHLRHLETAESMTNMVGMFL